MTTGQRPDFWSVRRMVREYQTEIVRLASSRNTPVLLAKMQEVLKLTGLPFCQ
jgi:hypothetical protein